MENMLSIHSSAVASEVYQLDGGVRILKLRFDSIEVVMFLDTLNQIRSLGQNIVQQATEEWEKLNSDLSNEDALKNYHDNVNYQNPERL